MSLQTTNPISQSWQQLVSQASQALSTPANVTAQLLDPLYRSQAEAQLPAWNNAVSTLSAVTGQNASQAAQTLAPYYQSQAERAAVASMKTPTPLLPPAPSILPPAATPLPVGTPLSSQARSQVEQRLGLPAGSLPPGSLAAASVQARSQAEERLGLPAGTLPPGSLMSASQQARSQTEQRLGLPMGSLAAQSVRPLSVQGSLPPVRSIPPLVTQTAVLQFSDDEIRRIAMALGVPSQGDSILVVQAIRQRIGA